MANWPTYDGMDVSWWREGLDQTHSPNGRYALAMFALFGLVESYLDVGCGTGAMVEMARRLGIDGVGVDQIQHDDPAHGLWHADLRSGFNLARAFRLVSCIEVAEHIPPECQQSFLDSLAGHVALGGVLVFTSPPPGLSGVNHVHVCMREPAAWREELTRRNLSFSHHLTLQLAGLWSSIWAPLGWLPATLQVFTYGTPDLPSGVGR